MRGIECGGLQPTVIEGEGFALAIFEEQLAIVGIFQRLVDEPLDVVAIHAAFAKEKVTGHP